MKDHIRIFGKKYKRDSLLYKLIRLIGKTGPVTGPLLSAKKFEINEVEVNINKLPEKLEGFRILHLTDIHAGDYIRQNYLKKMVSICNSLDPDIVVITGDFTETDPKDIEWSAKTISTIKNNYGIYGVLGNHDIWNGCEIITQTLQKNGIRILRNENTHISVNDEALYIAGIDDLKFGKWDLKTAFNNIPPEKTTIFLSHHPDIVEFIDNYKIDLMLCGHIHGGQWRFPIIGAPYVPSKFGKKHAWGLSKSNSTYIYTSKGIGTTTFPFRILCPPEIALICLESSN